MWTIERVSNHLGIDEDKAAIVIGLVGGTIAPETVPAVADWLRACYHPPSRTEQIMRAIDATIGTYGTEAIFGSGSCTEPVAEYCNAGDSYAGTILFDYQRRVYSLTTWGDWVETHGDRLGVE